MTKMSRDAKKLILLCNFSQKPQTVNSVINKIYNQDLRKGVTFMLDRGWRFYVHLNKLPAVLERDGLLRQAGVNSKGEKLWVVT